MSVVLKIALTGVVLLAASYDWRFRRIPNWVTLSGVILGLGLNQYFSGWAGTQAALLGLALAALVYVPLYCLRGMGAGDVKLMAAVGAIAGPRDWFIIFLVTAIVGGLVSFSVVLYKRRLPHTLLNLTILTSELLHFRRPAHAEPVLDVKSNAALRLPHALPIAFGSLLFLAFYPS